MRLIKAHRLLRQGIEMRRLHNLVATKTRMIRSVLVRHDNENVGLGCLAHKRYLVAIIDRQGE